MRPATPPHPKYDSACPMCGEPFRAARMMGIRLGDYNCSRCSTVFTMIKDTYYVGSTRIPAWTGEPLTTTQRHKN